MSDSKGSPNNGDGKVGRALPSWMSSSDGGKPRPTKKKHEVLTSTNSSGEQSSGKQPISALDTSSYSKLLDGVVFVLSGFVNPERSILRSQALEMGGQYRQDWGSDCTLLVCAFSNTPKFRQVEESRGTIVSKEWISECYNQKKLVDIESYLMHAGKPWRKNNISCGSKNDARIFTPRKRKGPKDGFPERDCFLPSEVKKWALDDLTKTISWLDSQEEKPEQPEIKKVAAEGILTCLDDAIDLLAQKKDIGEMKEQWMFMPRVVQELAKVEAECGGEMSKECLYKRAVTCKRLYEEELGRGDDGGSNEVSRSGGAAAYDSDETIEMTEEELEDAYRRVASAVFDV